MKARHIVALAIGVAVAPQIAQAQIADRLSIHGYLTQGYGIADGGQIFGIDETGTSNYGNAALQFRYGISSSDYVVMQFAHRQLGKSSLVYNENEITVDWAYYGRRIGDAEIKVGRMPIPAGIYNEVRDVGVLLPFYRAPFNFYLEGSYTSETVDGLVGSYVFGADKPWNVEVAGYVGQWDMDDRTDNGSVWEQQTVRATGAAGGQVWVNTPLDGIRVGAGGSRYNTHDVWTVGGLWKEWHASIDAQLPFVTAQAEHRYIQFPNGYYNTSYAYIGIHPISGLTLNGMYDVADVAADIEFSGMPINLNMDYNDEITVGASYAVSPNLVLKGELHRSTGYWADSPVLNPVLAPPLRVDYLIVSASAAF